MSKIDDALRTSDVFATLVNSYSESKPLGKAIEIRKGQAGHKLKFLIPENDEHVSPFNYLVIHTERRVVAAIHIKPIFTKGTTSIQISYRD